MTMGIITLLITILSFIGLLTQIKAKNFFAVAFAAVSVAVFGFFSIATIISILFFSSGGTV